MRNLTRNVKDCGLAAVIAIAAFAVISAGPVLIAMAKVTTVQADYANQFVDMQYEAGPPDLSISGETPSYTPPTYLKFVSWHDMNTNDFNGWASQSLGTAYCNTGHGYPVEEAHTYPYNVLAIRIAAPLDEYFALCNPLWNYHLVHFHYVVYQDGQLIADSAAGNTQNFQDQTFTLYLPHNVQGSQIRVGIEAMYVLQVGDVYQWLFGW